MSNVKTCTLPKTENIIKMGLGEGGEGVQKWIFDHVGVRVGASAGWKLTLFDCYKKNILGLFGIIFHFE